MCESLDIKDEKKQDILLPTNDYVFSGLFGHKGNEDFESNFRSYNYEYFLRIFCQKRDIIILLITSL